MQHFQPLYSDRFDTIAKAKKEVMAIMSSNPVRYECHFYEPCSTFNEYFPRVYEFFTTIQSIHRDYLSLLLCRVENFPVLEVACKVIGRLHPGILMLPNDGSIITTKWNESIVREIMRSEIYDLIGYEPTIETVDLLPTNIEANKNEVKRVKEEPTLFGFEPYYDRKRVYGQSERVKGLRKKVYDDWLAFNRKKCDSNQ